ncbi:MAG: metallophosphoesterase [Treponema sp.]|jgi:hypothetical protein|nr:metallophosphoesterase [Treponema sp.]
MRLAIGDIHGKPFWKHYLDEDYAAFYVTGDYFDSHDPSVGFQKQYKNFVEICAAARKDRRLRLCLGNHDYHYLRGVDGEQYSGFQERHSGKISEALEQNIDLFAIVRSDGDYLISHAGVTNYFLESLGLYDPLEINDAFLKDRRILVFNGVNIYGDDVTQSPIWIRPASLCADPLAGYNQIVGHTPVGAISELEINDGKNRVILIDTYDTESIYRF